MSVLRGLCLCSWNSKRDTGMLGVQESELVGWPILTARTQCKLPTLNISARTGQTDGRPAQSLLSICLPVIVFAVAYIIQHRCYDLHGIKYMFLY